MEYSPETLSPQGKNRSYKRLLWIGVAVLIVLGIFGNLSHRKQEAEQQDKRFQSTIVELMAEMTHGTMITPRTFTEKEYGKYHEVLKGFQTYATEMSVAVMANNKWMEEAVPDGFFTEKLLKDAIGLAEYNALVDTYEMRMTVFFTLRNEARDKLLASVQYGSELSEQEKDAFIKQFMVSYKQGAKKTEEGTRELMSHLRAVHALLQQAEGHYGIVEGEIQFEEQSMVDQFQDHMDRINAFSESYESNLNQALEQLSK